MTTLILFAAVVGAVALRRGGVLGGPVHLDRVEARPSERRIHLL